MYLFKQLGEDNGFNVEECAYSDINIIKTLYSSSKNLKDIFYSSIYSGTRSYEMTKQIVLPPLIVKEKMCGLLISRALSLIL